MTTLPDTITDHFRSRNVTAIVSTMTALPYNERTGSGDSFYILLLEVCFKHFAVPVPSPMIRSRLSPPWLCFCFGWIDFLWLRYFQIVVNQLETWWIDDMCLL